MNHLLNKGVLYLLYDFPDVIICAELSPYIVCNNQNPVKHGIHLQMHSNARNVQATFPFVQLPRKPQDLLAKRVGHEVCALFLPPINTCEHDTKYRFYFAENTLGLNYKDQST